jgi:hypothetical protein
MTRGEKIQKCIWPSAAILKKNSAFGQPSKSSMLVHMYIKLFDNHVIEAMLPYREHGIDVAPRYNALFYCHQRHSQPRA